MAAASAAFFRSAVNCSKFSSNGGISRAKNGKNGPPMRSTTSTRVPSASPLREYVRVDIASPNVRRAFGSNSLTFNETNALRRLGEARVGGGLIQGRHEFALVCLTSDMAEIVGVLFVSPALDPKPETPQS